MVRMFARVWGRFAVAVVLAAVCATAASAQPVKVTMLQELRTGFHEWQAALVEQFNKENPQIQIELISYAGQGVIAKLQTMQAAGVPIDIGWMDPYFIVDWGLQGLIEDLTPYIERSAEQFADWIPSGLAMYQARGAQYGLPRDLQFQGIFYNVDAYESAGLALPAPDWTYYDLMENARRLLVEQPDGKVTRYGFKIPTWRNWMALVWAFGGDFLDSWTVPARFTGNTDATREALEFMRELVVARAVQDRETHRAVPIVDGFINQSVAMGQTNTFAMAQFYQIADFRWDVASLPLGPAGRRRPTVNAIGWFMSSAAQDKEAAWEVLRFFTSPEALTKLVIDAGAMPPSLDLIVNVWMERLDKPDGRGNVLLDVAEAGPIGAPHEDIFRYIQSETDLAIWGEKPVVAALVTMEQLVEAELARRGGR